MLTEGKVVCSTVDIFRCCPLILCCGGRKAVKNGNRKDKINNEARRKRGVKMYAKNEENSGGCSFGTTLTYC
jgi:iron-sulfur cluster repair protein YtfE (RIC family)